MNTPDSSKNVSGAAGNGSSSTVQVDPALLEEAAAAERAAAATAGKTDETPAVPHEAAADKGGETVDDDEPQLPVKGGKWLTNGLIVAAILGVIALFGVAFVVVRNTASSPAVVVPSAPVPAAPLSTLPEVRTPAPRLIDASGCRRGQYRIEGNQLVFTNCATLELAEPPAR